MSGAWVLDLGGERRLAVALRQQLQLMHDPSTQLLAFAPPAANRLVLWNGQCVPVIDFGAWELGAPTPRPGQPGLLGIYACGEGRHDAPRFGALWLAAPPVRVEVDDADACELPPRHAHWHAVACFRDPRFGAVPIVDLSRIFGAARA
jgi:hypothetical protein